MEERYSNTERGILRPILSSTGIIFLALAYFFTLKFLIAALVFYLLSFVFGQLTVEERGERLVIRYGPLPLFKRSVRYADILSARAIEGGFLRDGWGIHWTRNGWSWNVGGSERVRIVTRRNALIVGTDDVNGLLEHLRTKIKNTERTP
jgi:hypothetical protein